MLTQKQVKEIREHLDKAQNPVFFFDNDEDGLCSFLLLRRYCDKGRGISIKSFPQLSEEYFRKVQEFNADYIFILDKPLVSKEFFEESRKYNIPVVWIDHHPTEEKIPNFVNYYNPLFNKKKSNEPVTVLSYQISKRKDDIWILVAGCIGDKFIPKEYSIFKKKYPELAVDTQDAWKIYYESEIGKIARMMSFGLKDTISNVVLMLKFLMNAKTPYEVLEENSKNKQLHKRFGEIEKKYKKLILEAEEKSENYKKLILFEYSGDTAISSDLSNRLMHLFAKRVIFVMRIKDNETKISGRGPRVKEIYLDAIKDFENARGGGHDVAIGGQFQKNDLEKFKKKIIEIVER
jgi:single-stranded DNA-specific DHH superfamily exonuclease